MSSHKRSLPLPLVPLKHLPATEALEKVGKPGFLQPDQCSPQCLRKCHGKKECHKEEPWQDDSSSNFSAPWTPSEEDTLQQRGLVSTHTSLVD